MQRQCAEGGVAGGGFRKAARHIMRGWKMRDIEDVGAAHGAVAIIVHRIQGIQFDLYVEARIRKRIRRKIDGGGELVEDGLEFRAGA